MARTKTKTAWETKIADLDYTPIGQVKIIADGFNMTFQNIIYKRRLATAWYFDGTWKGEYSQKENPIGQKFGRPYFIKINPNQLRIIRLLNGPKAAKAAQKEKILIGFRNYWDSSKALIAHLKKTCKQIEVID